MKRSRAPLAALAALAAAAPFIARAADETIEGPAIVIDAPGRAVGYLDIKAWEAERGRIPNGAILLLRAPGLSEEGAAYLARWRDLAAVGAEGEAPADGASTRPLTEAGVAVRWSVAAERPRSFSRIALAADGAIRVIAPPPDPPAPPTGEKRLVEIGWDIPDAETLAAAAAAKTPFDGAVFDPAIDRPDGKEPARFAWVAFGGRRIPDAWAQDVVKKLERTPAAFRASSFIRWNVTPADVPWDGERVPKEASEGWRSIRANAALAARIVREARLAGIFFDVEQYEGKLFDPREQPGELATIEERARQRGEEVMAAIVAEHPSIEILCSYGYRSRRATEREPSTGSSPPSSTDTRREGRSGAPHRRLRYSYPFKTRAAFARGRAESLDESRSRLGVAFGIWLDWNSGTRGWHPDDPAKNWFTPDAFRDAVRHARAQTDRWVWVYTERLDWYTGEGVSDVPEALRAARR